MRRFKVFMVIGVVVCTTLAASVQQLTGTWVSTDGETSYEIIDGFKPNRGAIFVTKGDDERDIGYWERTGDEYTMTVGWYSSEVTFAKEDVMQFRRMLFTRTDETSDTDTISIKDDEDAFIEKLTEFEWLDSKDVQSVIFRKTFSNDSGVVETFSNAGDLIDFGSWGAASGVLKIGSKILIESRVSDQYLLGLDQGDRFVIYKKAEKASKLETIDLKNQREAFLAALTTDAWFTVSYYYSPTVYRFRPVESELKGRVIETSDNELSSWSVWEYSPNTGAFKIGYYDYIGAILIGDTLALIDASGDQKFYRRLPGGANYQFTVADVTGVPLSETNIDKVMELLDGQFESKNYIYRFEFSDNKLNGFVHKFSSQPLTITGNTFKNSMIGDAKQLWAVEDLIIFDEKELFKRDTRKVRLRPISDDEANILQSENVAKANLHMEKKVIVKIRTKDNKTIEVALPISDFSQIIDFSLVIE